MSHVSTDNSESLAPDIGPFRIQRSQWPPGGVRPGGLPKFLTQVLASKYLVRKIAFGMLLAGFKNKC